MIDLSLLRKNLERVVGKRGIVYGSAFFLNVCFCIIYSVNCLEVIRIHTYWGCKSSLLSFVICSAELCINPYLKDKEKGNLCYEDFLKIMQHFPFVSHVKLQG